MIPLLLLAMMQDPITGLTVERTPLSQLVPPVTIENTIVMPDSVHLVGTLYQRIEADTTGMGMNHELRGNCCGTPDWYNASKIGLGIAALIVAWKIANRIIDDEDGGITVNVRAGDTNVEVTNPPREEHGHGKKGKGRGHDPGGE